MNNKMYEQVDDLKKIKKEYGEEMSHMCRKLFPTILENEGLLYYLLSSHFAKSKELYEDILEEGKKRLFKNYIYFYYDEMMGTKDKKSSTKSALELLKDVGYTLYECRTNDDIQEFRKYYTEKEALCTFTDPNRINNHYIFFIVKDNADKLDRSLFVSPKREDEYSLSVLDLQFDKGKKQRVSIKSRYNHTVRNPDATYSNNLENIVEGLTEAFEREYGFNIGDAYKIDFELDNYVQANDNKFYKYNYEFDNIHYCPNNIIIDNGIIIDQYSDKSRYTFMDYFILDEKNKKIIVYDDYLKDSFVDGLKNITNIEIINEGESKNIKLKLDDESEAIVKVDRLGRIIGYENKYLEEFEDDFLFFNECLQEINLPRLQKCGDAFLYKNKSLQKLNLPNLERCGNWFLYSNQSLQELTLPKLQECGDDFLLNNEALRKLNLPELEECGASFLLYNKILQDLNLPKLHMCWDGFLYFNRALQKLDLPELRKCWDVFLYYNESLQELNLPELRECGDHFLYYNESLRKLNLPKLQECGDGFLYHNQSFQELNLPELRECGVKFLCCNSSLKKLNLPNLESCGSSFLFYNEILQEINLPKLKECVDNFLDFNKSLKKLSLPELQECGDNFLYFNELLQELDLPELQNCGYDFLFSNKSLQELNLPKLEWCAFNFLWSNEILQELSLPNLEKCGFFFLFNNRTLQELNLPNLKKAGDSFLGYNEKLYELNLPSLEEWGSNFIGGRFDDVISKVKKR